MNVRKIQNLKRDSFTSRFLSIKYILQRTRNWNWRWSRLIGLFHHVNNSLFGLHVFPLVWLCRFAILSFWSLLPSLHYCDFLLSPCCSVTLFTWTVMNHQGWCEMQTRTSTGSQKKKKPHTFPEFSPTGGGLRLYSHLHLLQGPSYKRTLWVTRRHSKINRQDFFRISPENIHVTSSNVQLKWKQMYAGKCGISILGCWSMFGEISVTLTILIWYWSSGQNAAWERQIIYN